jgi:hypothetical protein
VFNAIKKKSDSAIAYEWWMNYSMIIRKVKSQLIVDNYNAYYLQSLSALKNFILRLKTNDKIIESLKDENAKSIAYAKYDEVVSNINKLVMAYKDKNKEIALPLLDYLIKELEESAKACK